MEHVGHVKLMLMEVVGSVRERVQRMERWEHVKRRLLFVVQTARVILVVLAHKSDHEINYEIKRIRLLLHKVPSCYPFLISFSAV